MQQYDPNQAERDEHAADNPALSVVIERNIRTIINLRQEAARKRTIQDRLADAITLSSGHMSFVYIHILWFGTWILLNTGWLGVHAFDPIWSLDDGRLLGSDIPRNLCADQPEPPESRS